VREALLNRGFLAEKIVSYAYRPFDTRWIYWEPETKLLDEKRSEYFPNAFAGNFWIEARQKQTMERFDRGYVASVLADNFGNGLSTFFPLYLRTNDKQASFLASESIDTNLSEAATAYVRTLGLDASHLFYNSIGLLHSPNFRLENSGALRQDWPRIPLPSSKEALLHSAVLGRTIAALLDTERGVAGVTEGKIQNPLDTIGVISRLGGGQLQIEEDEARGKISELRITAGWGHGGKGGITMPGKGRLNERDYTPEERKAILDRGLGANRSSSPATGEDEPHPDSSLLCLGEKTYDIYLNDVAYWRNIPARVWEYTIGGYQVIKKWLSYREHKLLGRPLTTDEAREVMNIARRIASILLLEPSLDANYQAIKTATYPWPLDQ